MFHQEAAVETIKMMENSIGFHTQKCENQIEGLPKSCIDGQFAAMDQKVFCSVTICPPTRLGSINKKWASTFHFTGARNCSLLPRRTSTQWILLYENLRRARSRDNPTTRWVLWSQHFWMCGMISTLTTAVYSRFYRHTFKGSCRSRRVQLRTSTALNALITWIDYLMNLVWWLKTQFKVYTQNSHTLYLFPTCIK